MPHRALALTHKLGTKRKGRDLGQTSGPKKRKVSGSSSKAKGKLQAVESDSQDNFGDEDKPAFILSDQDDLEDVSVLSNDNAPTVPSQKSWTKICPMIYMSPPMKTLAMKMMIAPIITNGHCHFWKNPVQVLS